MDRSGSIHQSTSAYQGCLFTNEEFLIAIRIRLHASLHLLCPARCICGAELDDTGNQLFKCRVGPEWEQRHSAIFQFMSTILRSINLTVRHEVPLIKLGRFMQLASSGSGRVDLTVISGNSIPILANINVTHPIMLLAQG